ncbi:GNAT superfamily N-acetyltransferase [Okibacterium sp. HSC-33S16]|uniref:GNAT family N-acetyltransferase n=1 Tax=Okibacterium sp. HSC-33S16 TaxID=2910965 RepID=UPI00209DCCEA|nr:GNAT family N-acetyltransferase [Okibacterium sp. HSC-33S16]MCP2031474.1 GNAT superfamily N-acetyltransferase [Okibacterium sp. HSC-33S16]
MSQTVSRLNVERREYSHHDVVELITQLQALYAQIYGGQDASPIHDAEFLPPRGALAVGYVDGQPVAMGAWRKTGDGTAELKRMFVVDGFRGQGFSRSILTWLETSAIEHGITSMVLETNQNHPAAIALYRSVGYRDIPPYGYYADNPRTVSLGRDLVPADIYSM